MTRKGWNVKAFVMRSKRMAQKRTGDERGTTNGTGVPGLRVRFKKGDGVRGNALTVQSQKSKIEGGGLSRWKNERAEGIAV